MLVLLVGVAPVFGQSVSTPTVGGLGQFLYDKGAAAAKLSQPLMLRDFVNNRWMYGAAYPFYQSAQFLPKLIPPQYRSKLALPPVNFYVDIVAPMATAQGTPLIETSIDLTQGAKSSLLWMISKLPANLDQHLSVVTNILSTDASGSGILSLGGAGGRDFNRGQWIAGLSMHLVVKYGQIPTKSSKSEPSDALLAPGSDTSSK